MRVTSIAQPVVHGKDAFLCLLGARVHRYTGRMRGSSAAQQDVYEEKAPFFMPGARVHRVTSCARKPAGFGGDKPAGPIHRDSPRSSRTARPFIAARTAQPCGPAWRRKTSIFARHGTSMARSITAGT
mmetsp:Transcript_59746/g.195034  ORF Transcript_59746/g.195034 Transcript_59746/m.195034 type:complete len:128 (+) Transcript_59746:114-497(+)